MLEDHRSGDWSDLATTRAGQEVQAKANALRQAAPIRTLLARLLGVHTEERAWRLGGDGEQAVGKQLGRLGPGWRVLHSIVLSAKGTDLDHLVIGPGGVFCINTKNHPHAAIWVAGASFMVNGQHHPYVRASENEAKKVSRVLTSRCGFDVPVRGVIAVVNANTLTVKQQPAQVRIASRRHLVEWLSSEPHCFSPEKVDSVYSVARRSSTWASNEEPSAPVKAVSEHPTSTPANSGAQAMTIGLAVTIRHRSVPGTRLMGDPRPHTALVRAAGRRASAGVQSKAFGTSPTARTSRPTPLPSTISPADMSIFSLSDFNGVSSGWSVWLRYRHRGRPEGHPWWMLKEGWGLLLGHTRGHRLGHTWGVNHGHGHPTLGSLMLRQGERANQSAVTA